MMSTSDTKQIIRQPFFVVIAVTALLLTIPLVAMQFTDEVNWTQGDFALMAGLLIACGTSYVFLRRFAKSRAARLALALLVLTCFVLIWAELAVGLLA
jgi:predicted membrane protein